jgi:hypothetical protein
MSNEKKMIAVKSSFVDIECETVDSSIELLKNLAYASGGDAEIVFEHDYEGDSRFYAKYSRLETDAEFKTRIKNEERSKQLRLDRYIELKKEFDGV